MVAHLVKALFVNTSEEHSLKHLKELKIRAHILVGLGRVYIEHGHEDMCKQENALTEYTKRVEELYPAARFGCEGGLIEEIDAMSKACSKRFRNNGAETPAEMKNAAMPDLQNDPSLATLFDNVRPQHVLEDSDAGKVISAEMQVKAGLGNFSEWKVRLQNGLEGQSFTAKYMSRVLPFVFNYMAGGPEFEDFYRPSIEEENALEPAAKKPRWRRVEGSAVLTPPAYVRNLARRPELQLAAECTVIPIARNLCIRHAALNSSYMKVGRAAQSQGPSAESAEEYVKAATQLLDLLDRGVYYLHGKALPVNGDVRNLRFADGLATKEGELLDIYQKATRCLAGSQEIRRSFIPFNLGFRVVYGEVIFLTATPDRRHSALVWRLMRARQNDTALFEFEGSPQDAATEWRRKYCGPNTPGLYAPDPAKGVEVASFTTDVTKFNVPTVKEGIAVSARDPLSTVLHYDVTIRVILSWLCGIRMCFHCPRCSIEAVCKKNSQALGLRPCQNKFGRSGRVFAGSNGLAESIGGATEFQANDTPHFHGIMAVATPYQLKSLAEIARLIESDVLDPSTILRYVEQTCREDHYDDAHHQSRLTELEQSWQINNDGDIHKQMAFKPAYFRPPQSDSTEPSLWTHGSKDHASPTQRCLVQEEGKQYRKQYETDVQEVFSHTQHHWHSKGDDGSWVPFPYCRKKCARRKKALKKNMAVTRYANKTFLRRSSGATSRRSSVLVLLDSTVSKSKDVEMHCVSYLPVGMVSGSAGRNQFSVQV
jgi:hypothetical protein